MKSNRLTLFGYEVKNALLGMKSHWVLCLSSVTTVTLSLLLVSVFVLLGLHVNRFSEGVTQDLTIHVVLKPEVTSQTQLDQIQLQLQETDNVRLVRFSDRDQELEAMIAEKGDVFSQYRGEENPLANAYYVSVEDESKIADTARSLYAIEGVDTAAYGGSSVVRLVELLETGRWIAFVLVILLVVLSLYLIYNTIRATIYTRRAEIGIMRTVGATSSFIRVPFELEGMLIGLIGSLVPLLLVLQGYPALYDAMNGRLLVREFSLLSVDFVRLWGSILLPLSGLVIGWLAAAAAAFRYCRKVR